MSYLKKMTVLSKYKNNNTHNNQSIIYHNKIFLNLIKWDNHWYKIRVKYNNADNQVKKNQRNKIFILLEKVILNYMKKRIMNIQIYYKLKIIFLSIKVMFNFNLNKG